MSRSSLRGLTNQRFNGHVCDTIEEDAVKAHTRTMSGVNQVTQALRHQKSRTCFMKCVCVFAVVMTLVILFVLLMIKKR